MHNEELSSCEHSEQSSALYDPAIPPPPPFALIGREQELAHMKQQLQGGGNAVLTLHGLPGVGKTSLAITLAHDPEVRDAFSDGILWVGVGPNPNLSSLLSRWASLMGISATQMERLRELDEWAFAIRNAIGRRKMLLIIDDVWQYEEVQTLRVGGHNCAYLITTRSRDIAAHLALDGTMMIEELNAEQSVQLLNRTAQEVISHEPHKVQGLVQAVGGLPLALTLLGNYLRKQASQGRITTILERLSNAHVRFQISEPHISVESHPCLKDATSLSLQSVIAVTDQLLTEAARTVFYRLAIFPPKPNTFSEEAALAVTACTFDELDILSDAGLLEESHGDRHTLHQVISDYAHLHLHEAEEREAYSRLIAYIADYVEAHKKDYELLDLESNTIYLVLSQAHAQGKQAELVRVVCAFAPFLILRGRYLEAQRHLQQANQAARTLNDSNGITVTLLYLGEIEQRLGNYALAESALQEGLTLARQMNDNEQICALLTQLGIVLQEQGNSQQAETAYQEGLTLARNRGANESICTLLDNLGWLIMKRGEFARSETYLQEGLALARKIGDRERVGGLLRRLGALEGNRGNFVQAQSHLQEGLAIARKLRDSEQICALLINLGVVAKRQGKTSPAKMYYLEGLELARQVGHRERVCSVLINLGGVFVEEDNYVQAELYFQEGLELVRQIGHREGMSTLLINLGMTKRLQGHYNEAKAYLQESFALANQISRPDIICPILCELGDLSLSEGSTSLADEYFKRMLEQIPSGDQRLLALAYYGLARVCALQGDTENARLYGSKSVAIFEMMGDQQAAEVRDWVKYTLG
jgi:tetratricopeptide (TPR) repeat protein